MLPTSTDFRLLVKSIQHLDRPNLVQFNIVNTTMTKQSVNAQLINVVEPNSQTWVSDRAVCYLWIAIVSFLFFFFFLTVKRDRYFLFVGIRRAWVCILSVLEKPCVVKQDRCHPCFLLYLYIDRVRTSPACGKVDKTSCGCDRIYPKYLESRLILLSGTSFDIISAARLWFHSI